MKFLYTQKKENKMDNPQVIADEFFRAYKIKVDKIPPAFPCENEILVFLCFENYGKLDQKLVKFCQDLSTARAHNVALIIFSKDGSTDAGELTGIFQKNGVNIAGTCGIAIPKGLFGAKKVTKEDEKKAMDFCDKVVKQHFGSSALS